MSGGTDSSRRGHFSAGASNRVTGPWSLGAAFSRHPSVTPSGVCITCPGRPQDTPGWGPTLNSQTLQSLMDRISPFPLRGAWGPFGIVLLPSSYWWVSGPALPAGRRTSHSEIYGSIILACVSDLLLVSTWAPTQFIHLGLCQMQVSLCLY